jgi:phosphoenolpyruvate-protein kinase (PTS system EI component)
VKKRVIRNAREGDWRPRGRPSERHRGELAERPAQLTLPWSRTPTARLTSHIMILARSQGVPAVLGVESIFDRVESGDTLVVDGNTGTVIVNATPATLEIYRQEIARFHELEEQLLTLTGYPAQTLDGREFMLCANLDSSDEVVSALDHGAQGVGLFRTEYFFISQEYLPSEEEQSRCTASWPRGWREHRS